MPLVCLQTGTDLLERTTLKLLNGHRYGVLGRNGVGKTTLLKRLARQSVPGFPTHLRCHLVDQELRFTSDQESKTPVEVMVEADKEMAELQKRSEDLTTKMTDEASLSPEERA